MLKKVKSKDRRKKCHFHCLLKQSPFLSFQQTFWFSPLQFTPQQTFMQCPSVPRPAPWRCPEPGPPEGRVGWSHCALPQLTVIVSITAGLRTGAGFQRQVSVSEAVQNSPPFPAFFLASIQNLPAPSSGHQHRSIVFF